MEEEKSTGQIKTTNSLIERIMKMPVSFDKIQLSMNPKRVQMKIINKESIDLDHNKMEDLWENNEEDKAKDRGPDASNGGIRQKHIVFKNKETMKKNKKSENPIPKPVSIHFPLQTNFNNNQAIYCKKKPLDKPRQFTPQGTKRNEANINIDPFKCNDEMKISMTPKSVSTEFFNDNHNSNIQKRRANCPLSLKKHKNPKLEATEKITEVTGSCMQTTEGNVSKYMYTEQRNNLFNMNNRNDLFNEHIKNLAHIQEQYEKLINKYPNGTKANRRIKVGNKLKNNLQKNNLKLQNQKQLNSNKKLKKNIHQIRQNKNLSSSIFTKYCTNYSFNAKKPKQWSKKVSPINIFNIISNQQLQSAENTNPFKHIHNIKTDLYSSFPKKNQTTSGEEIQSREEETFESCPIQKKTNSNLFGGDMTHRYSLNIEETLKGANHSRNMMDAIVNPLHSTTISGLKTERVNNNEKFRLFYNYSKINLKNEVKDPNHNSANDMMQIIAPDTEYKFKYFHFNSRPINDPVKHEYSYLAYDTGVFVNRDDRRFSCSSHLNNDLNQQLQTSSIRFNHNNNIKKPTITTGFHHSHTLNQYDFIRNSQIPIQTVSSAFRDQDKKEQMRQLYEKAFIRADFKSYESGLTNPMRSTIIKDITKEEINNYNISKSYD